MDYIKPFIERAEKCMIEKKWKEALGELEIALDMQSSNYKLNMLAARCCFNLKDSKRAEPFLLSVIDKKPDDLEGLRGLCMLYKEDQNNQATYLKYLERLCDAARNLGKHDIYFDCLQKIYDKHEQNKNYPKMKEICNLIIGNKDLDESKKNNMIKKYFKTNFQQLDPNDQNSMKICKKALNGASNQIELEILLDSAIKFIEIIYYNTNQLKKFYNELIILAKEYTKSVTLLKAKIEYSWIILDNIDILRQLCVQSIAFLVLANLTDKKIEDIKQEVKSSPIFTPYLSYENIQEYISEPKKLQDIYEYCLLYRSFCDLSNISSTIYDKNFESIRTKLPKFNIEDVLKNKSTFIYTYPLLTKDLLLQNKKPDAAKIFKNFNEVQKTLKSKYPDINIRILEEVSTNLGLEVSDTKENILEQRKLSKDLYKNDEDNIEKAKLFYTYQMKSMSILNDIDEEINIFNLVKSIYDKQPNNAYFASEKAWHILSYSDSADTNYNICKDLLEKSLMILNSQCYNKDNDFMNKRLESTLKLRYGTLIWVNDLKNNTKLIKEIWLSSFDKNPNNGLIIKALGLYYIYIENNYDKGLKCLLKSFEYEAYDENYFKLAYFLIIKINKKAQALKFLKQIYYIIKDFFWINYILALIYIEKGKFEKALSYILKATDILDYNIKEEKKSNNELLCNEFAIKYNFNRNGIRYLNDIPHLSDEFYEKNGASLLSEKYYLSIKSQFHIYFNQAQIFQNCSMIGACQKTLLKCEQLLINLNMIKNENYHYTGSNGGIIGLYSQISRLICEIYLTSVQQQNYIKQQVLLNIEEYPIESLLVLIKQAIIYMYLSDYTSSMCCLYRFSQHALLIHNIYKGKLPTKIKSLEKEFLYTCIEIIYKHFESCLMDDSLSICLNYLQRSEKLLELLRNIHNKDDNTDIENCLYYNKCMGMFEAFKGIYTANKGIIANAIRYYGKLAQLCLEGKTLEDVVKINQKLEPKNTLELEVLQDAIGDLCYLTAIFANFFNGSKEANEFKDKAKKNLKWAKKNFRGQSRFYMNLALIEDDSIKKISYLLYSYALDYQKATPLNIIGMLLLKEKKYYSALKIYQKSLEANTTDNYQCFCGISMLSLHMILNLTRKQNMPIRICDKSHSLKILNTIQEYADRAISYSTFSEEMGGLKSISYLIISLIQFFTNEDLNAAKMNMEKYMVYPDYNQLNRLSNHNILLINNYIKYLTGKTNDHPELENNEFLKAFATTNSIINNHEKVKNFSGSTEALDKTLNQMIEKFDNHFGKLLSNTGENSDIDMFTANYEFYMILKTIHTIALLFLAEDNLTDSYNFLGDYITYINDHTSLNILLKNSYAYNNLQNVLYELAWLYLEVLVRLLAKGNTKNPEVIQEEINRQIIKLCKYYEELNEELNPLDLTQVQQLTSESYIYNILYGLISLKLKNISRAKLYFYHALRSNPESIICRKWMAWFNANYERKKLLFAETHIAEILHSDYKIKRDQSHNGPHLFEIDCNYNRLDTVEYITKINNNLANDDNTSKVNKFKNATKAALYLNTIDSWYLYCLYYIDEMVINSNKISKSINNNKVDYIIEIIYIKIIKRITDLKSENDIKNYQKILKNSIYIIHELLYYIPIKNRNQNICNILKNIQNIENNNNIIMNKVNKFKNIIELINNPKDLCNKLDMKNPIKTLKILIEIYFRIYSQGISIDYNIFIENLTKLELLAKNILNNSSKNLSSKDHKYLNNACLIIHAIKYTILSSKKIKFMVLKQDEELINVFQELGKFTPMGIYEKSMNTNTYAIELHRLFSNKDIEQLDSVLTDMNYITLNPKLGNIFNVYALFRYYYRLKDESTSQEEYGDIMQAIDTLIEEIRKKIQNSYIISLTYWIKAMSELHIEQNIHAIQEKKKFVKGLFAKAALITPEFTKEILLH